MALSLSFTGSCPPCLEESEDWVSESRKIWRRLCWFLILTMTNSTIYLWCFSELHTQTTEEIGQYVPKWGCRAGVTHEAQPGSLENTPQCTKPVTPIQGSWCSLCLCKAVFGHLALPVISLNKENACGFIPWPRLHGARKCLKSLQGFSGSCGTPPHTHIIGVLQTQHCSWLEFAFSPVPDRYCGPSAIFDHGQWRYSLFLTKIPKFSFP